MLRIFDQAMPSRARFLLSAIPVVWIVALHGILFWLAIGDDARGLVGDEGGYLVAARGLLATGELVLDSLWPPLYAWFLAGVLSLGGPSMLTLAVVQLLLLGVAAVSLRCVVAGVLGSVAAGNYAALMMLGYPTLAAFAYYLWPEVLYLALFLGGCALLVRWPENLVAAGSAGFLLGAALLCKLVLWPFLPLVMLPLFVGRGRRSKRAAAIAFVVAVALTAVAGPALRPSGGAARVDTNIAFNLLLGLKNTSRRTFVDPIAGREYRAYVESADDVDDRTRILWNRIGSLVADRGSFRFVRDHLTKQYMRLFDPESFFTAQLPGGALQDVPAGYHGVSRGLGTFLRALTWTTYFALLAFAAAGVAARPWRHLGRVESAWITVFGLFFFYNMAIFFLLNVVSRYRIAMLPVFFLFAAAAMTRSTVEPPPSDA